MQSVVVDSGVLVAYFDRSDRDHKRVYAWYEANSRRYRFATSCAVVTEVTHLLDFDAKVQASFLEWVARGAISVVETGVEHYHAIADSMKQYRNVPMDFADASVLWTAEALGTESVLTTDFRGFRSFRLPSGRRPELILAERTAR